MDLSIEGKEEEKKKERKEKEKEKRKHDRGGALFFFSHRYDGSRIKYDYR